MAAFALAAAALFAVYLRLSRTLPENSDMANILLAASDMLHGNLLLHGWYLTDVSFYTTEVPQYALLEIFFGVHAEHGAHRGGDDLHAGGRAGRAAGPGRVHQPGRGDQDADHGRHPAGAAARHRRAPP